MKNCVYWLPALMLAACVGNPSGVVPLQEEDFGRAYAEVLLTGADPQNIDAAPDSIRSAADSTLAALGIRKADFEASIETCNRDIRRWVPVLERVVEILTEKQKALSGSQRDSTANRPPSPLK